VTTLKPDFLKVKIAKICKMEELTKAKVLNGNMFPSNLWGLIGCSKFVFSLLINHGFRPAACSELPQDGTNAQTEKW
jgi:hypothetical protein